MFSFFSDAAAVAIKLSFGEFHEIFAILLLQRRLHDIVSIVLTVCAKALSTAAELVRVRYEKMYIWYFTNFLTILTASLRHHQNRKTVHRILTLALPTLDHTFEHLPHTTSFRTDHADARYVFDN